MRPKRCSMCPNRARPRSFTCSEQCAETRAWKQKSLNRHRDRSKVAGTYTVTVEDWLGIVKAFGGCCAYCGRDDQKMTVDHVLPLSRGGRHCVANIVPACGNCNHKKGNLTVMEWKNYSKGKQRSKRQQLNSKARATKHWFTNNETGLIAPKLPRYKAQDAPIFDQLMTERYHEHLLENILLTVDHHGLRV